MPPTCMRSHAVARHCERISHLRTPLAPCISTTSSILLPSQTNSAFSTSRLRRAQSQSSGKTAATEDAERRKRNALRTANIPEDLGLFPGTFVMPSPARRPSWISQFRQRLRLERARWKTRLTDALSLAYYRFSWHTKPRPRLRLTQIPSAAKELHRNMYENFAAGTLEPLQTTVIPGFLGKLRGRIAQRPNRMPLRWKLHEYKSAPRLMSLKVSLFPGPPTETSRERRGLVQAVVRIHSLQSLHHIQRVPVNDGKKKKGSTKDVLIDARGRELSESEYENDAKKEAKESVEYVVLQKRLLKSQEGPWKIWGTTEETTLEKLDREQRSDARDSTMVI